MSSGLQVVVDLNVVLAALLNPTGWTARELRRPEFGFHAPDWILDEMRNPTASVRLRMAQIHSLDRFPAESLPQALRIIPRREWETAIRHPKSRLAFAVDEKDVPYVAAAVIIGADLIWTRDRALQSAFPGWAVPILPDDFAPSP